MIIVEPIMTRPTKSFTGDHFFLTPSLIGSIHDRTSLLTNQQVVLMGLTFFSSSLLLTSVCLIPSSFHFSSLANRGKGIVSPWSKWFLATSQISEYNGTSLGFLALAFPNSFTCNVLKDILSFEDTLYSQITFHVGCLKEIINTIPIWISLINEGQKGCPCSVTGVAWRGWPRDWGARGPRFNSRGHPTYFRCQFHMK